MSDYTTDNIHLKKPASGSTAWGDDVNENWEMIDSTITELKGAAPATLDTLEKLASAINDDSGFSTTVSNQLDQKAAVGHGHQPASTAASGFLPQLPGDSTKLLDGAGNWTDIPDTTALETYLAQLDATNKEINLFYNGAFEVSQQNGDTVGTTSKFYPADELKNVFGVTTPISAQRVDPDCQGFTKAVRVTIGAGGAVDNTSAGYAGLFWNINGRAIKHLKWGTADARYLKLRLRIKASVSGNYAVSLRNVPNYNRSYVASFNIAPSEVGSYVTKTVRVPGCTDGVWPDADGTAALLVSIQYGTGSSHQTTNLESWETNSYLSFVGAVNLLPTEGAYLEITGCDAYSDDYDIDREFPHKTYDEYLWDCQKWACWLEPLVGAIPTGGTAYSTIQIRQAASLPRAMPKFNGCVVDTNAAVWHFNTSSAIAVTGDLSVYSANERNVLFTIPVSGGVLGHSYGVNSYRVFIDGRL